MPTEQEARWAQMAGQAGAATSTMPPAAPAAPAAPAPMPGMSEGKKRGRKEKAPKAPKAAKEPKAPKVKAERAPRGGGRNPLDNPSNWDMSLEDSAPSRQEMEQVAAAELFQALAPSYDLLHEAVPDAASPEDAQRRIESQLGAHPNDIDSAIPGHPIWKGDALVYQQLKRHYGRPHKGSSFARSWYPTGSAPRGIEK